MCEGTSAHSGTLAELISTRAPAIAESGPTTALAQEDKSITLLASELPVLTTAHRPRDMAEDFEQTVARSSEASTSA